MEWGPEFVEACRQLARERMGLGDLRPLQVDVLQALGRRPGVLATLPTGAGKTLLYALPALLLPHPIVVISPLIALMRDQVRRMVESRIPAVLLTSEQSEDERRHSWREIESGEARLIFVSPERVSTPQFVQRVRRLKPSMVVVDEAHCVVSWGLGFRPEYAELSSVIEKLNPERILALTATAGREGRTTIAQALFPEGFGVEEVLSSPVGTHLLLESLRVPTEDAKLSALVQELSRAHKNIVYFTRRDSAEECAHALRKLKFPSLVYHAGLSREERQRVETYIQSTQEPVVICATVAFGMGIDLSNVRTVVCMGFPSGIEEFLQMVGRAGRGGEASRGILLWNGSDPKKRQYQIEKAYPENLDILPRLRALEHLFPKSPWEKRFVDAEKIHSTVRLFSKDAPEDELQKLSTLLRATGAMENVPWHTSWIELQMQGKTLGSLLSELPPSPTRRRLVLESLEAALPEGFAQGHKARTVLQWVPLREACALSDTALAEVLDHYATLGALEWKSLPNALSREGWILRKTYGQVLDALPRWNQVRADVFESFHQLDTFARTNSCRMGPVDVHFGNRKGASKAKHRCLQCDRCMDPRLKPFEAFVRLTRPKPLATTIRSEEAKT